MTHTESHKHRTPQVFVVLILATMTLAAVQMPSAGAQNLPASVYSIEGYVYDNRANPLADATVTIFSSGASDPTSATTDTSGKYAITGLSAGKYNATASAPGLVAAFVPIQVGGADSKIQQSFLLRAPDQQVYGQPLTLKGIVKNDATGAPIADAIIEIWNYYYPRDGYAYTMPSNAEQRQTIRSAADGSYSATLSEGSANINVRKDGFDVLHASFEMRADRLLDLPMLKSSSDSVLISGTVKSIDGTPLPDAWVNVQPDYRCETHDPNTACAYPAYPRESRANQEGDVWFYYEPSIQPYNSTATDKNGKFQLRTLPGKILVTAQANDHLQKMKDLEAQSGDEETVDFQLEKIPADSVRLFGRVIDAETGKPIPWAQLNVENQKWGHHNYTQTKEDGTFEVWTKPGYTIVTASAYQWYYAPCAAESSKDSSASSIREPYPAPCEQGERDREYMPRVFTIVAEEGKAEQIEFELLPRPVPDAVFQGYVVNKTSQKGVAGAQVSFYNELTRDYGTAVTDEEGSYKIKVHGGYYTVRVYAPGYFDVVQNAEIKSGATERLDLFATAGERNYGYCCYTYAGMSKEGYAVADSSSAHSGSGTPAGAPPMMTAPASYDEGSAASAADSGGSGRQAYLGEGGGLGPYAPAGDSEPGGKAPGLGTAFALIGALAAVLLVGRRKK